MKYRFYTVDQVRQSPLFDFSAHQKPSAARVFAATRLEDMIFDDICAKKALQGCETLPETLPRDVFQAFFSHKLRETADQSVRARHLCRPILERLVRQPAYPALQKRCAGQETAAFAATAAFCRALARKWETKMPKKDLISVLVRLEAHAQQLLQKLQAALQADAGDVRKICKLAAKTASKQEQVRAVNAMLAHAQRQSGAQMDAVLSQVLDEATEAAELCVFARDCWQASDAQGEVMQADRDLQERLQNNSMLRDITRQLGRMKEVLSALRRNGHMYGRGEKYAITRGNTLRDVLSAELALLAAPETLPLFLKRYRSKNLRQYERRAPVRKGGGDVIVCLDESGSMRGERIVWAKALALALQDICAHDKRRFALIHFSGQDAVKTDLFLPGNYTSQDLMDAALHFWGGSTDFEAPLRQALTLLENADFQNADIVFVTDGQCDLDAGFCQSFLAQKAAWNLTLLSILIGDAQDGASSLEAFSDHIFRYQPAIETLAQFI